MSRSMSWIFLFLPLMGLNFESSGGEKHSLIYIYTAFSKDPDLPGLHQFTAMGLLDNKMIDYFDSDIRVKEPRQDWMKDRLYAGYWTKGTKSRISKEQWFKVNIQILKDRLKLNDTDTHVLQWMHGCEGEKVGNNLKFSRGLDRYSYNGQSFLYFDETNSRWVAEMEAAKETKRKWNDVSVLKEYTKGYLENECLDWLSKFLTYGEAQMRKASPPDVFIFSKKTKDPSIFLLICFTTGFYRKDIELNIKRDGRVLTLEDGVKSSGIRPNGDDTYQRRDMVEILQTDTANYSCEVIHRASKLHVEKQWDGVLPDDSNWGLFGGVVGGLVLVVVLVVVLIAAVVKRRGPFKMPLGPRQGSVPSVGSSVSFSSGSSGGNNTDGSGQPLTPGSRSDPSVDSSVNSSSSGSSSDINTDGSGQPLLSVSPVSEDVPNPSDRPDEE